MKMPKPKQVVKETIPPDSQQALLAGGCFWCLESAMQALSGVLGAINGYAGGPEENPTYEQVYTQKTGHKEAVLVYFDPQKINYDEILDNFWRNINPTDGGGQFYDRGPSYQTAIFYLDQTQKRAAESSKNKIQSHFSQPIATEILPYTSFYEAESYHQDFYKKHPWRYRDYTKASGREEYKQLVWQAILKDQEGNP